MMTPKNLTFDKWTEMLQNPLGGSFYQISHQSAEHARLNRGIKHLYPNHSTDNFSEITPADNKGQDYLAREMLSNYDAIEKHKDRITAIILEELNEGKDTFVRRLAKAKKKQIDTLNELKDLQSSPLPHPPAMQAHMRTLWDTLLPDLWDKKEELLVKHWDKSISDDLPPLCLWSDSAIDSWICEILRIKVHPNGTQQIKDKRLKLQLLSMPFEVVTPHGEGIEGLHCQYPCTLHKKRLKALLPRITINHLVGGAFELDEGAFRLQFLRCFKGWDPKVLSWIDEICEDQEKVVEFQRLLRDARESGVPDPFPET